MMVCNLQEFIENIPDPAKSAMWKSEVMKATLKLGLDAAWKEVGDNTGNVTLQLKPVKRLLAARALAVGQLRLVALSPVVAMYCEGQKVPAAAVAVPSCDPGDATKAHVLPKAVGAKAAGSTSDVGGGTAHEEDFIVPFWHVRSTPDQALGNVSLRQMPTKGGPAVPVMVNTVPIPMGAEILRYKGAAMEAAENAAEPAAAKGAAKGAGADKPKGKDKPAKQAAANAAVNESAKKKAKLVKK